MTSQFYFQMYSCILGTKASDKHKSITEIISWKWKVILFWNDCSGVQEKGLRDEVCSQTVLEVCGVVKHVCWLVLLCSCIRGFCWNYYSQIFFFHAGLYQKMRPLLCLMLVVLSHANSISLKKNGPACWNAKVFLWSQAGATVWHICLLVNKYYQTNLTHAHKLKSQLHSIMSSVFI